MKHRNIDIPKYKFYFLGTEHIGQHARAYLLPCKPDNKAQTFSRYIVVHTNHTTRKQAHRFHRLPSLGTSCS